ncbi:probable receptor-like protein kinase At5g24010 [Alnus glutinosa]|uniref:probable receptor-like protein kinase At5g24010 n=1 Tax=Alnus glutinosa TaxID=3517 RepID=UPI002D77D00C|nr:probable receptor-like protein kinase At5g24010 [Alnus glutinosa]
MVVLPFFLLHFLSLLLLSSANSTLPDEYFINCGSKSNITVGGRNFVGDLNSGSFSVGTSSDVSDTNSATDMSLYQTARIFKNPSSYEFDIIDHGIYYVRLHFFPFMSGSTNLADALFDVSTSNFSFLSTSKTQFDVSTSNFSLLTNFGIKDNRNSPVIEEFLLTINGSKFSIYFTPHRKSFAFVSAIEVFLIPDKDFVMDDFPLVTAAGSSETYVGVRSQFLRTIHRVNVGGPQNNDTLWRTWIPDDDYLLSQGSAKNCVHYNGTLTYDVLGATNHSASDLVYRTCKELNSNSSNITWRFGVNKNTRHLVRLHFCDIVSAGNAFVRFNLSIYRNFSQMIYPDDAKGIEQLAAPFYYDFVVDSDDSGVMYVSVGPRQDSLDKNAYLNGLEIMEFMKKSVPIHRKTKKRVVIIVATACGAAFVFVLVVLLLLGLRYKKAKHVDGVGSLPVLHGKGNSYGKGKTNASPVRNVDLNWKMNLLEIQAATHNFDAKLLIGEGGFGKVYQGTLRDGTKVAVKRSDPKHGQGLPEFETEILVLSKIRHRHLVSLKGYCEEGSEMILVYEFIEKGPLRDHLYDLKEKPEGSSKRSKLSWKQRLEICIGSAKGLHYLHTSSAGGIIHRDVKSTNILLNEQYVAKVADFGLSRSGPLDPNHFSTVGIKGSFGYVDPEYFRTFEFTDKSDVYSFGVVLLEVLCARPAIIDSPKREEVNLAEWGMFWQKKGKLERIIDPLLVGEINADSLRKFGEIVEKCLKDDGAGRPSMLDVQWDLEYALQLQQTALHKETLDDSTTNAFLELPVPSDSVPDWEDDHVLRSGDDGSETTDSGVFSQMRIDGAR